MLLPLRLHNTMPRKVRFNSAWAGRPVHERLQKTRIAVGEASSRRYIVRNLNLYLILVLTTVLVVTYVTNTTHNVKEREK